MTRLADALLENAEMTWRVVMDKFNRSHPLSKMFYGGHDTVTHSHREYVRHGN